MSTAVSSIHAPSPPSILLRARLAYGSASVEDQLIGGHLIIATFTDARAEIVFRYVNRDFQPPELDTFATSFQISIHKERPPLVRQVVKIRDDLGVGLAVVEYLLHLAHPQHGRYVGRLPGFPFESVRFCESV